MAPPSPSSEYATGESMSWEEVCNFGYAVFLALLTQHTSLCLKWDQCGFGYGTQLPNLRLWESPRESELRARL